VQRSDIIGAILDILRHWDFPDTGRIPVEFTEDTVLFGREGLLDSIGLVALVLDVEEAIGAVTGRPLSLVNDRALSRNRSPFRSVGSLADFAAELLAEPPATS